jgi:hypothetical protein
MGLTWEEERKTGSLARSDPTPPEIVRGMLALARVGAQDTVYVVGRGDARILLMAVKEFGDLQRNKYYGVCAKVQYLRYE